MQCVSKKGFEADEKGFKKTGEEAVKKATGKAAKSKKVAIEKAVNNDNDKVKTGMKASIEKFKLGTTVTDEIWGRMLC